MSCYQLLLGIIYLLDFKFEDPFNCC